MERGVEWEERALEEAWAVQTAREDAANELLLGSFLVLGGSLLVILGFMSPTEYCIATGAGMDCSPIQTSSSTLLMITSIGGAMIGWGGRTLWRATEHIQ
jgi:hypothetical protein